MKHYGLTIDLKDDPELIAQYKHHHANPWDGFMRTFQSQVSEAKEGEWWAEMEMVFDLHLHV